MLYENIFRRDGTPYPRSHDGFLQWMEDFSNDELRIVAVTETPEGCVSTIWIGVDRDLLSILRNLPHEPMIFETIVWDARGEIIEQYKWPTEGAAIVGHAKAIEFLKRLAAHARN